MQFLFNKIISHSTKFKNNHHESESTFILPVKSKKTPLAGLSEETTKVIKVSRTQ